MKPRDPNDTLTRKQTREATRKRRESQICKVVNLKLDQSHFSKIQEEFFDMVFIEAKRLYNYIINYLNCGGKLRKFDTKIKTIQYSKPNPDFKESDPDSLRFLNIDYELKYLNSKMIQGILQKVRDSLNSIFALKKKGHKTGRLGFAKSCDSIELSQYINQYEIVGDKLRLAIPSLFKKELKEKNQSFKLIRVHGTEQLVPEMELTSAKLIRKPSGLYLHITTYQNKVAKRPLENIVGLDKGIKHTLATSDSRFFESRFPITDKIKDLQRKLEGQIRGSGSYVKTIKKIKKEFELLGNKKDNATNQIIGFLKKNYGGAVWQDDNISSWKNTKGKSRVIQNSILGRLKKAFRQDKEFFKKIERYAPSTKLCYVCLTMNPCPQGQDTYHCKCCGLTEQRDVKAAKATKLLGLEQIVFDLGLRKYIFSTKVKMPNIISNQRPPHGNTACSPNRVVDSKLTVNDLNGRNEAISSEAQGL